MMDNPAFDRKALEAARRLHHRDGEVEIDEGATVSDSDEGAYVACWVWVDFEDPSEERADEIIAAAREQYHEEGVLELDQGARASIGDDPGAYVSAWAWVGMADIEGPTPA